MSTSVSGTVVHCRDTPASFYQTSQQDKLDCLGLSFAIALVYTVWVGLFTACLDISKTHFGLKDIYVCCLLKMWSHLNVFWPAFCIPGWVTLHLPVLKHFFKAVLQAICIIFVWTSCLHCYCSLNLWLIHEF